MLNILNLKIDINFDSAKASVVSTDFRYSMLFFFVFFLHTHHNIITAILYLNIGAHKSKTN